MPVHRTLFNFGDHVVYSYSVMLGLAVTLALGLAVWRAPAAGISRRAAFDGGLVLILVGILGSRLPFLLDAWAGAQKRGAPSSPVGDWALAWLSEGATVLAGVGLAVLCGVAVVRWLRVDYLVGADLAAPSIALGQGVGRIGCFLAGCCHGKACDLPWAVQFPDPSWAHSALGPVRVHPSQLYASAFGLALCWFLVRLARRPRPKGTVMATYLLSAGLFRIVLDTTRHYPDSALVGRIGGVDITQYQIAALLFVAAGTIGLALLRRTRAPRAQPQP